MPKKNVPIRYTSRDFGSIKQDLINHARRYYPDTYRDFNEAGFGAMMMDAVAYLGDQLSFYVDYQANESFLETANEFDNIRKLATQLGYREILNPSSQGVATFFILVPANPNGLGPDPRYYPILKKGSIFSTEGGNDFTLNEDVFFDGPLNEIVVGQVDSTTGLPTSYAVRGYGRVISGIEQSVSISVGDFVRFLRLEVNVSEIAEIISVTDDEGHEYFEVDYLSQDVIYRPVTNRTGTSGDAASLLRPFTVPRRFIVEKEGDTVFLRFGQGVDSSDTTTDKVVDPSNVVLRTHGKQHFTDENFDPANLVESDKFGVSPQNTTLEVVVRTNTVANVNAGVDTLTTVTSPIFEFTDPIGLNRNLMSSVRTSLECTNEEPILGDVLVPDATELKQRVYNSFSAQNRAVTREDYITMIYKMPSTFGSVKRVNVVRDRDSFKRNLNIYVVSEDSNQKLVQTNQTVKENMKVWLNKNRMINDTIDILDAKIINFCIDFEVVGDLERDKYDILSDCVDALKEEYSILREIGQPFYMTDVYSVLKEVDGVVDVDRVKVRTKTGNAYSRVSFSVNENLSQDGRYINIPVNAIFEIKYPNSDIRGVVK